MGARTYTVTGRTDLHFDGSVYREGDAVELLHDVAAPLLADGIVVERKRPKGAKLQAAIRAAIEGLDTGNAELWTTSGKPKTEALEAVLGYDISAAERDEAHAAIEAARKTAAESEGKGKA